METVQLKYNNFKSFVNAIAPKDNEFVLKLNQAPLEQFLIILQPFSGSHKSREQALTDLFAMTKLERADYSTEVIDRFCRYMEYFNEINNL